jgi:hypothetical protein
LGFNPSAGEVDARFDGKWIGVEIFPLTSPGFKWKVPQVTIVIVIEQSGKVLNCPVRISSWTLAADFPKIGRQHPDISWRQCQRRRTQRLQIRTIG